MTTARQGDWRPAPMDRLAGNIGVGSGLNKIRNCLAAQHEMSHLLDGCDIEFLTRNDTGHLSHAKPRPTGLYWAIAPTDSLNTGINHKWWTSAHRHQPGARN